MTARRQENVAEMMVRWRKNGGSSAIRWCRP